MSNSKIVTIAQRAAARGVAVASKYKGHIATGAAAAPVAWLIAATPAFAAKSKGGNAITNVFGQIKDNGLNPFYKGLIGLVAFIVAIILVKEIIQAATAGPGTRKSDHIAQCIVVLIILLIAAFLPEIVGWVIDMGNNPNMQGIDKEK